jgi:frataxin-like iron-binding protein CyaY
MPYWRCSERSWIRFRPICRCRQNNSFLTASRAGGFHYKHKRVGDEWRNTRDNTEFFTSLSDFAGQQGGVPVKFG